MAAPTGMRRIVELAKLGRCSLPFNSLKSAEADLIEPELQGWSKYCTDMTKSSRGVTRDFSLQIFIGSQVITLQLTTVTLVH